MKSLSDYQLSELKLIYNILHENIQTHFNLMDSELLSDLQTYLQQQAQKEGIDVTLHQQWKDWLDGQPNYNFEEHPGDIGA